MSVAEVFFAPDNTWKFFLQGTRGSASLVIGVGTETYVEFFRSHEKKPERTNFSLKGTGHVGDAEMRDALVKTHFSCGKMSPDAREGRAGVAVLDMAMESEKKGRVMRIPWPANAELLSPG